MNHLVTSVELIHTSCPRQTSFGNIVQSSKVEVSWYSMNRANAHLVQSSEKIIGNVDRLSEFFSC